MSDTSSKRDLPGSTITNEEVIDSLTKNLESSLTTKEPSTESFPSSPETANVSLSEHPDFFNDFIDVEKKEKDEKGNKDLENEFENTSHFEPLTDTDEELTDEMHLKDFEVTATDEEKTERRLKAEKHKIEGNDRFRLMEYEESIECYSQGLKVCPLSFPNDRAVLYSNRAAVYKKLEKNKESIKDCTKAIESDNGYVKAYYRRAQCHELEENFEESLADYNKILELDPQIQEARAAVLRLPPLIEAKNEKLKTEMFSKLKELGNMFLRPFGLSTDNFQVSQNPGSEGYSINFNQNKQ